MSDVRLPGGGAEWRFAPGVLRPLQVEDGGVRAAVVTGLRELRGGVETLRGTAGAGWLDAFAGFYMGQKRTCEPGLACTLPSLSPDVERADPETRAAYQEELTRIVAALAEGFRGSPDETQNRA